MREGECSVHALMLAEWALKRAPPDSQSSMPELDELSDLQGSTTAMMLPSDEPNDQPNDLREDALRAWCIARGLAKYKCPERVRLLDAVPLLASGKADRVALRAVAARPVT